MLTNCKGCLTDLRNFSHEKTQLFNYYSKTKGFILKLPLNIQFFCIKFRRSVKQP